jgi:CBS domain-containing protein
MKVEEVMTRDVITLDPEQTVAEAVERLAEHRISGAPVVNGDGEVVGMLTETDILTAIKCKSKRVQMVYPSLSMLSVAFVEKEAFRETLEAFAEISGLKVSEIMAENVAYAEAGMDLSVVIDFMNRRGFNRVPVMEGGRLVGIVSRADVIKGLARPKKKP